MIRPAAAPPGLAPSADPGGQLPGEPASPGTRTGPVIVLACAYAGAARVVEALAADPAVAATTYRSSMPCIRALVGPVYLARL